VASAGPVATRQRVEISLKGRDSFVLKPLTPGAIERDSGQVTFCCWSERHIVRDGEDIEINDPRMTLVGKHGTLVTRNRIEWVDLPDGWSIFTGTWKVVGGAGAYAGLGGGGRAGGVRPPGSDGKSRFAGFLVPR
jgi:hypothetical protein